MSISSPIDPSHKIPTYSKNEKPEQLNLEKFCERFCPNITVEKMKEMISEGAMIEQQLLYLMTYHNGDPEIKKLATPENAVNLIWLFMSKAAKRDDLYTNGAMKIAEGEVPGKVLEQFFKDCGQGETYTRISSHMKETQTKQDRQYGLDLRDKGLPANKHHILFFAQPDGSLYLKLEQHGCPPFWKENFRSFKNFKEYVGHAISFITSRPTVYKFLSIINLTSRSNINRKEKVPEDLKKQYKKTLFLLFPPKKTTFFQKLRQRVILSKEGKAIYESGKKHGISQMRNHLLAHEKPPSVVPQLEATIQMLSQLEEKAKKGISSVLVKGNEVIIPPLGK